METTAHLWRQEEASVATTHLVAPCSERTYGHFERVVPVRWPVEVKGATAELAKGVLVVRLPKLKDRRGSEIAIPIAEKDS